MSTMASGGSHGLPAALTFSFPLLGCLFQDGLCRASEVCVDGECQLSLGGAGLNVSVL